MSDTEQPRRPKRTAVPSARVTCAENAADLELSSHRKAQVATRPPEGDNTPAPAGEAGPKRTRKVLDIDAAISNTESDAESPPKKKKGEFAATAHQLLTTFRRASEGSHSVTGQWTCL